LSLRSLQRQGGEFDFAWPLFPTPAAIFVIPNRLQPRNAAKAREESAVPATQNGSSISPSDAPGTLATHPVSLAAE